MARTLLDAASSRCKSSPLGAKRGSVGGRQFVRRHHAGSRRAIPRAAAGAWRSAVLRRRLPVRTAVFRRAAAKTFSAPANRHRRAGFEDQENFQQDVETWLAVESKVQSPKSKTAERYPQLPTSNSAPVLSRVGNSAARRQTPARRRHQRPPANARRAGQSIGGTSSTSPQLVVVTSVAGAAAKNLSAR